MDLAQTLLKEANLAVDGFLQVCLSQTMSYVVQTGEFIQILYNGRGDWQMFSNVGANCAEVLF